MESRTKAFLKFAIAPIILMVVLIMVVVLWRAFGLPERNELVANATVYYAQYGLWVIFLAAIAEGLLLVNWYLPGSLVIVLGVVLAREHGDNIAPALGIITSGFFITSIVNYALGRFGWYHLFMKLGLAEPLASIRAKVENKGLPIIFSTYFHPNVGALTATSAGILKLPFKIFALYSLLALIIWNSIWGIAVYFLGSFIVEKSGPWMIAVFLTLWIIVLGIEFYRRKTSEAAHIP